MTLDYDDRKRRELTLLFWAIAALLLWTANTRSAFADWIPPANVQVTASSQETELEAGFAVHVTDGDLGTVWVSRYSPAVDPGPHSIALLFEGRDVSRVRVTPRQGGSTNGLPVDWRLESSPDGVFWLELAAGTGDDWSDRGARTIGFEPHRAQLVRFTIERDASPSGDFAALAELEVWHEENLGSIGLAWDPVDHPAVSGFRVYWRAEDGGEYARDARFVDVGGTGAIVGGLEPGDQAARRRYCAVVRSIGSAGQTSREPSNEACGPAWVAADLIPAPLNLILVEPF
ncbi:MAG: hypothetical protein GY715_13000 [Planctomycetes bacterium]|nr:hypothetical protein [Planctomycetota bacterium]